MSATDDATRDAGVRWLASRPVTIGVVSLLLAVFAFGAVVRATFGPAAWRYVFLAHLSPSPGWVMAPFAHYDLAHLLTTLPLVAVYGGLVEGWLPGDTYLAFYVLTGYASTATQLGAYLAGEPGIGTLGASGVALGLVGLYTVRTVGQAVRRPDSVTAVSGAFAGTGAVVVGLVLANDFLREVSLAGGTAAFGHVGGILAGVGYGLVVVRTQQQSDDGPSRPV